MASMLLSVDRSLGRILDKLEELGIADDTVVIFTSDNGGNAYNHTLDLENVSLESEADRAAFEDWLLPTAFPLLSWSTARLGKAISHV
jgi:arylsulfatase A-like enzyme